MKISLNNRLFNLFKRNFKNELIYYNNAGLIYYLCQNFDLGHRNMNEIKESDLYLKDFLRNTKFSPKAHSLTVDKIKNEEARFLDKVINILRTNDLEHEFINIYRATAINYMMFHLLVNGGFLELRYDEANAPQQLEFGPSINDLEVYANDEERVYLE